MLISNIRRIYLEMATPRKIDFKVQITPPAGSVRLAGLALCAFVMCASAPVVSAEGVLTPSAASEDACLPIEMPPTDVLFSSSRKVFAHYFNRFPLSFDNRESGVDYYATQYLNPHGESDKWLAEGGFLRSRPLPVPRVESPSFAVENLKREVRLAISRGITGFTFDILAPDDLRPGSYLPNMLKAASEVDSRFQIVLMPDMASLGPDPSQVIAIVKAMYHEPSLFHLPDGRLVIAPFLSESVPPSAWENMMSQLAKDDFKVAFVPTFLSPKYLATYGSPSDGFGTFGTPLPMQKAIIKLGTVVAHAEAKPFMAGIGSQGYRPKEYHYWEAQGSLAYRSSWLGAIEADADWVQLTTWNDFSESTQILPYTDLEGASGTGYFNLTGYYASWFLTGKAPLITHDVLYYFYRKQPISAAAPKAGDQVKNAVFWQPGKDIIEVVGFLTAPGTLAISIGGKDYSKEVGSGMQSFTVPIGEGVPRFSLSRGNNVVIAFDGVTPIAGSGGLPGGYADLTYWSGSASKTGTCYSNAIRW
jgi:hypothetical protein